MLFLDLVSKNSRLADVIVLLIFYYLHPMTVLISTVIDSDLQRVHALFIFIFNFSKL